MKSSHCEVCGSSIRAYWHNLTPGLVEAFQKFAQKIRETKKNQVHPAYDLGLNINEYNNFQKLQYFSIVKKMGHGSQDAGYWMITDLGKEFFMGRARVPRKMKTYHGQVIDSSVEMVSIRDIIREVAGNKVDAPKSSIPPEKFEQTFETEPMGPEREDARLDQTAMFGDKHWVKRQRE